MKCIKCKEREQVAAAYARGLCHVCLVKQAQDHLAGLKAPSVPSGFIECPKCGGVGLHAPTCGGGFVDSEAGIYDLNDTAKAIVGLQSPVSFSINPAMFGPPMVGKYPSWWNPPEEAGIADYRGERLGHPATLARFASDFARKMDVWAQTKARPT